MRFIRYACIVALACGSVGHAQDTDIASQLKRLEGKWRVAHRAHSTSKKAAQIGKVLTELGNKVKIEDDKLSPADSDKAGDGLTISFDPTAKPKAVDLTLSKTQVLYGVYSVEGDILSLNFSIGNTRPQSVVRTEDEVLLILKRIPKR